MSWTCDVCTFVNDISSLNQDGGGDSDCFEQHACAMCGALSADIDDQEDSAPSSDRVSNDDLESDRAVIFSSSSLQFKNSELDEEFAHCLAHIDQHVRFSVVSPLAVALRCVVLV